MKKTARSAPVYLLEDDLFLRTIRGKTSFNEKDHPGHPLLGREISIYSTATGDLIVAIPASPEAQAHPEGPSYGCYEYMVKAEDVAMLAVEHLLNSRPPGEQWGGSADEVPRPGRCGWTSSLRDLCFDVELDDEMPGDARKAFREARLELELAMTARDAERIRVAVERARDLVAKWCVKHGERSPARRHWADGKSGDYGPRGSR